MDLRKIPFLWIFLILIVVAAVGGAFYLRHILEPPRLGADFCPQSGDPPAHFVVLIDQSDPFAQADVKWMDRVLSDVARRAPRGGRVTLMALMSDTPFDPDIAFTGCSPGSPDDADERYQNPEMIRANWQKKLVDPLQAAGREILEATAKPQPSSPLLEAVVGIRDSADFQPSIGDRRIIILSDLVQNSDQFSFFKAGVAYAAFERTSFGRDVPDLKNVKIEIRLVPRRTDRFAERELRAFWREYAKSTDAELGFR